MTEFKKVTAPVSAPLAERLTAYLAANKGRAGYPQTQREFLILAIEHLLVDLDAEARDNQPATPAEPAANCPLAERAETEQLAG